MDNDKFKEHFLRLCEKIKQLLYTGLDFVGKELDHRKELLFPLGEKSLKKYKEAKRVFLAGKARAISILEEVLKQVVLSARRLYGFLLVKLNHLKGVLIEQVKSSRGIKDTQNKVLRVDVKYLISMPFIYALLIPVFGLHVCLEMFQQVCFRIYQIQLVRARSHVVIDRSYLLELNWFEKSNYILCCYYAGITSYAKEVFVKVESCWQILKKEK